LTVLVLDGHTDAALAVLQSLGRSGYACWIADCVRRPYAALRSRYASQTAEYPDPLQDKPQFQEWVVQFQQAHRFDLIIPVTEATLIPLDEHRAEPALSGVVAIPPATAVEVAFDKEKSRQLAASLGIPTPRTVLLSTNAARGQLDEWLRAFPVVVKATRSRVWRGGRGFRMEVALARTRSELDHVLDRVSPLTPVQVQDWMPGSGLGVEVLVRSGEVLWSFAHRRIHENPVWGGASTYREAIVPPPDLLEATATLMRRLAWHGVAMVEFRVNPATGERWFLEINGRFWGSLPLAIHAGADFPRALVELLLENRDPPSPAARTGVYARNLAKDVRWTKNYLRQRRTPDPHLLRRPALGTLLEWSRVLTGREIWDGASVRDPGPIVHEVASTAWNELRTFARGARRAWVRRRARASSIARLRNLQATRRTSRRDSERSVSR
jgi:predicted ATP-grasp superfamily ATP-dependent carboligase